MGKIKNTIKDLLNTEFNPETLIIENESFMHNVPENSGSHFKIAKFFLERKINVISEKPLTLIPKNSLVLNRLAKKRRIEITEEQ